MGDNQIMKRQEKYEHMNLPMLVADRDIEVSKKGGAAFEKRGISHIRVETMQDAIEELIRSSYWFTVINADNIDYLPLLRTMRNISPAPIFVFASNFSVHAQMETLHHGADVYTPLHDDAEDNVISTLAWLHKHSTVKTPSVNALSIISHGKLLVCLDFKQIFYNDKEIPLTKKEYDIFHYLISYRGNVIPYNQIYRELWNVLHPNATHDVLWTQIRRLRQKLKKAMGAFECIENIRNIGYRFTTRHIEQ